MSEPSPGWAPVYGDKDIPHQHTGMRYHAYPFFAEVYWSGPGVFRWHIEAGEMRNPHHPKIPNGYRAEGTAPTERDGPLCAEAVAKALRIWTRAR